MEIVWFLVKSDQLMMLEQTFSTFSDHLYSLHSNIRLESLNSS